MKDVAGDLKSAAARAFTTAFDGVIRLEPADGAALWVDGRTSPPAFADTAPENCPDSGEGVCVWRGARDTLAGICAGDRLLGVSYLSGRLMIAGDMSIMARLVMERAARG